MFRKTQRFLRIDWFFRTNESGVGAEGRTENHVDAPILR
jgi:hypothetical protein